MANFHTAGPEPRDLWNKGALPLLITLTVCLNLLNSKICINRSVSLQSFCIVTGEKTSCKDTFHKTASGKKPHAQMDITFTSDNDFSNEIDQAQKDSTR